ncbi:AI-2E family transporter [soil metagenome]
MENINPPFYIRFAFIIIGIIGFAYIMYVGQDIMIPLLFAALIAILINPFCQFLERKTKLRILSIFISVFLTFLITAGVLYFLADQMAHFSEALPQLKQNFSKLLNDTITWVSGRFNIDTVKINRWIAEQKDEGLSKSTQLLGQTLTAISSIVVIVLLLPVYIFLFLFYKPLLLSFIAQLFSAEKHKVVAEVLSETKTLIQSYLVGLMVEAGIVAALNASALLILGIDYAILVGIIGALLNVIPYIGGLVAVAIPIALALATKEPIYALWVLIAYLLVQFIDNNLIVPKIVASKVKINALISIIVVLVGGAFWGVPGMFLSLPLAAILKVIFDRIQELKPWGFLIGDTMPPIGQNFFRIRKSNSKNQITTPTEK